MTRFALNPMVSPEMQLLCACCRVNASDADIQMQATLAPLITPKKFIALVIRHRVAPLVHHNLKQHAPGVFPGEMLETLAARVRRNAIKSLQSLRINLRLAGMLRERGIPYLPLKGVTIAQRYYGSINLRHTHDLDFWVPEKSLEAVRALLAEQGCQRCHESCFDDVEERGDRHRKFLRGHQHHDVLTHPDGEKLEVHWRLTSNDNRLLLDPADMVAGGEPTEVAGESIVMIEPVSLLLYLCEHGGGHGWYRLKWLLDLPQILESREWDWPDVLAKARRAHCLASLLLGLKLAQQLFGWAIPEVVAQAMKKQLFLSWQVNRVYRNLDTSEVGLVYPTVFQGIAHVLYRMSFARSFSFVWTEFTYHLLSHNDLRAVRLPDRFFFLYYFLRPVLIWRQITKRVQVRQTNK